jgi:hypothetical protein
MTPTSTPAIETVSDERRLEIEAILATFPPINHGPVDKQAYRMALSGLSAFLHTNLSRRSLDSADGVDKQDMEVAVHALHEALGGNGWAYSNYGNDELHSRRSELEAGVRAVLTSRPACTAEAEPVAWLWTDAGGRLNASIHSEKWDRKSYVATMGGAPLYLAPPSPAQSAIVPPVVEVTEEMVFAAMAKADELGDPLDDIDAREILLAALQAQRRGE